LVYFWFIITEEAYWLFCIGKCSIQLVFQLRLRGCVAVSLLTALCTNVSTSFVNHHHARSVVRLCFELFMFTLSVMIISPDMDVDGFGLIAPRNNDGGPGFVALRNNDGTPGFVALSDNVSSFVAPRNNDGTPGHVALGDDVSSFVAPRNNNGTPGLVALSDDGSSFIAPRNNDGVVLVLFLLNLPPGIHCLHPDYV